MIQLIQMMMIAMIMIGKMMNVMIQIGKMMMMLIVIIMIWKIPSAAFLSNHKQRLIQQQIEKNKMEEDILTYS